jgi:membrane fusion protein (multidrug efflux system)
VLAARFRPMLARLSLLVLCAVMACTSPEAAPPRAAAGPVEVGVVTLAPTPVTLTRELPGRVSALRVAEVRARVNGIVEKRLFEEGSVVQEGQPLYRIESDVYAANLASARANAARAEATLSSRRLVAERDEALVEANAVSREAVDTSEAALRAAEAELRASRAAVKSAKISLEYTTVTAPITGRIGRSEVTEGAYVQQSAATLMATIQQLDKVYVDVTQSVAELQRLRRELESDGLRPPGEATPVTLILEDGSRYSEVGTLQFTDVTVDASTGSVTLRAVFPNPRGELLPGMFVRAVIEQGTDPDAILVPQRAVTRDQRGQATALVVGADRKVERRVLEAARVVGDAWLVTSGLSAGDQVIVEGLQKIRPGVEVTTVPAKPMPSQLESERAAQAASEAKPAAPAGAGAPEPAPASEAKADPATPGAGPSERP